MRTHNAAFALLFALAPLAACDTASDLAAPDDEQVPIESVADEGVADLVLDGYSPPGFDELASKVPGFAGYWFDRRCNLHVRMTDLSWAERIKELLEPVLRAKLAAEPRCPDTATIIVQGAEFSWIELKRFAQALRPASQFRGVVRMGISVPLNRIVVAVTGRPPAHLVIRLAEQEGVPSFALKFVLADAASNDGRTRDGG